MWTKQSKAARQEVLLLAKNRLNTTVTSKSVCVDLADISKSLMKSGRVFGKCCGWSLFFLFLFSSCLLLLLCKEEPQNQNNNPPSQTAKVKARRRAKQGKAKQWAQATARPSPIWRRTMAARLSSTFQTQTWVIQNYKSLERPCTRTRQSRLQSHCKHKTQTHKHEHAHAHMYTRALSHPILTHTHMRSLSLSLSLFFQNPAKDQPVWHQHDRHWGAVHCGCACSQAHPIPHHDPHPRQEPRACCINLLFTAKLIRTPPCTWQKLLLTRSFVFCLFVCVCVFRHHALFFFFAV